MREENTNPKGATLPIWSDANVLHLATPFQENPIFRRGMLGIFGMNKGGRRPFRRQSQPFSDWWFENWSIFIFIQFWCWNLTTIFLKWQVTNQQLPVPTLHGRRTRRQQLQFSITPTLLTSVARLYMALYGPGGLQMDQNKIEWQVIICFLLSFDWNDLFYIFVHSWF